MCQQDMTDRHGWLIGSAPTRIVCLLCLTKVPPCHSKLAKVSAGGKDQSFVLEPVESLLAARGNLVETGVAQSDKVGSFTVILQSHPSETIYLEEGEVIGSIQAAQIVHSGSTTEEQESMNWLQSSPGPTPADVTVDETTLLHLSPEERDEPHSCFQEYASLIAKEESDLGSTDLVNYAIDTSDHSDQTATQSHTLCIEEPCGRDDVADGGEGGHLAIQESMGEPNCFGSKERWNNLLLCGLSQAAFLDLLSGLR